MIKLQLESQFKILKHFKDEILNELKDMQYENIYHSVGLNDHISKLEKNIKQ